MWQRKMFMAIQILKKWAREHWPLLVSLGISLVILGPLLAPGYILTYDMVFSPHVFFNFHTTLEGYGLYNALPVQLILKILSFVLPMDTVQKVVLVAIFFLAIYGIYLILPLPSKTARLFAGLMYGLNPFVYDRLMAGHWKFLLSYALTPFVLKTFWRLFQSPNKTTVVIAVLTWAGTAIISSHHLLILGILFIGLAITFVRTRRSALAAVVTILGVFILSSWWLVPLLLTPNATQAFGLGDLATFTARPDTTYGIWPTLLSLQGFWFQGWQPLGHFISIWPLIFALWLIPVCIGVGTVLAHKDQSARRLTLGIGIAALFSLLFVAGPSAGFGDITTWLFLHLPGLSGMREPQKLIGLLALFYAVAAGYGFAMLAAQTRRIVAIISLGIGAIFILIFSWPLVYGVSHQIVISQYPESWRKLSQTLRHNDDRALVLPYELYINKSFAGQLVADPAPVYFNDRVITSNDPKLPSVHNFTSSDDQKLAALITAHDLTGLQHELQHHHVSYIILINSDGLSDYMWITGLPHSVFASDRKSTILELTTP